MIMGNIVNMVRDHVNMVRDHVNLGKVKYI